MAEADITLMLRRLSGGNPAAADELAPIVYNELRRIAGRVMRREPEGRTIQPTALVHEAYMRLIGQREVEWQNRAQFFSLAARIMRRILLDMARRRVAERRGGPRQRVTLEEGLAISEDRLDDVIAVDEALAKLAALDERQARIVEMRFFAGLTHEDIAAVLEISPITVKRDWNSAKAWLYREMSNEPRALAAGA